MMELSIFLAKFFGVYFLLFFVLWIWRKDQIEALIKGIFSNKDLLGLSGIISLMFGSALVVSHSIWELNWRGLITIFGYLAILKGVIRMGFPDIAQRSANRSLGGNTGNIVFLVLAVIGCYLAYSGFTAEL